MAKKEGIIQFAGMNELSPEEQETVQEITTRAYEKIQTILQNLTNFVVHIKTYKKEGERKKYSLTVRCAAPTQIFESKNASDWELARAVHKSFEDIQHQIEHKLHTNRTRPDMK